MGWRETPRKIREWGNVGIYSHGRSSSLEKLDQCFPSQKTPAQLGIDPEFLRESCCGVLPVLPPISVTLSQLISFIFPLDRGQAVPEQGPAGDSGVSCPFPHIPNYSLPFPQVKITEFQTHH